MEFKNICLVLLSCFFPGFILAQTPVFEGRVMHGKEAVSFATIGVKGKNIGTVANENGYFKLILPTDKLSKDNDTIIVSSIGFIEKKLSIDEIGRTVGESQKVFLEKDEFLLEEVKIKPGKVKVKRFGNSRVARLTSHTIFPRSQQVDDALGRETGMVLKIDTNITLRDFNIYISGNQFKNVRFRLQFYDLSNDVPVLIPVGDDILFDIGPNSGWIKVDLKEHDISIRGKEKIGVTIQWLTSEKLDDNSRFLSISGFLKVFSLGGLYRPKSQALWQYSKWTLSLYLTADSFSR